MVKELSYKVYASSKTSSIGALPPILSYANQLFGVNTQLVEDVEFGFLYVIKAIKEWQSYDESSNNVAPFSVDFHKALLNDWAPKKEARSLLDGLQIAWIPICLH